jgi:hypothetical protein
VAQLAEVLSYNPKDRRFDSQWCLWSFELTLTFGSTQTLREKDTRDISLKVKAASAYG